MLVVSTAVTIELIHDNRIDTEAKGVRGHARQKKNVDLDRIFIINNGNTMLRSIEG